MTKPKGRGAGIMLSDFVEEKGGFLALTESEYQGAKTTRPSIKPYAREFLEYGENKEDYWTPDKFMSQMERIVTIAEIKYPSEGWHHAWVFDHSSCHAAMADDALDVLKMNVNPTGKQRLMHDTVWNVNYQSVNFTKNGQKVAKGMETVLQERGISTLGKKWDWMRKTLSEYTDFKC